MKNKQIANSWPLWQEYMDAGATMTEAEFEALTVAERIELLESCFGADDD